MRNFETISLEELFNRLSISNNIIRYKDYELIECDGIKIKTFGNKYVDLLYVSRHKTKKNIISIIIKDRKDNEHKVNVTTDHICMTLSRDKFFENKSAKDLSVGEYVSVYDRKENTEILGVIEDIQNLGSSENFVYDCEVDDESHSFYANNILCHNSQFMNLQCISKYMIEKYNLPNIIREWPEEKRREMWDIVEKFVNTEVNGFVRDLVHNYCHTNQQNVLTYELEYMSDVGIYEGKKHYATHKIFEEGDKVDKTKYSGIELKKAQIPVKIKKFMKDIYDGVLLRNWQEKDYNNYISEVYSKFREFDIDDISFWKGYNTERKSVGFLSMEKGTTGIAKACTYTNQIIEKLGLTKKYDEIRIGDKVRFCYVDTSNIYNINCLAYKPGQYPDEFRHLFKPDYVKMFYKLIVDPLKKFRESCGFEETNPTAQTVFDIFEL